MEKTTSLPKVFMAEAADFRLLQVSCLAALIGIVAGGLAFVLLKMIGLFTNLFFYQSFTIPPEPPTFTENPLGWWLPVVTTFGGLLVGLMAKYGSPKIKGHGIPEAMEAVLFRRSRIDPRVAILKPLSAGIAIGAGGPFGAEGPIIQTGGAFGSIIGQVLHVTAAERKVLLACGAAAGMAATFSTPIAAVILAIELLLFEFKSRSFIPLVIASTLATSIHFVLFGRGPLFVVNPTEFGIPHNIPYYVVLGLLCGGVAVLISKSLFWIEDLFERLPIDELWWPAIGGLLLGFIGLFVPRVLGVGYGTITEILNNQLPLTILVAVMVFKLLAMLLTLGSGTSGGLLAPTFMSSAAMGAVFAIVVNQLVPGANLSPGACALVAMAAVFGAASRATFTFIIFAFEITRDYNAILPLMLVSVIADGISLVLMKNSIMTEKLVRRGLRVHQEYEADILQQLNVQDVMVSDILTVPSATSVAELATQFATPHAPLAHFHAIPIVAEDGTLAGIITRGDVLKALQNEEGETLTVLQAGSQHLVVTYPDEPLHDAIIKMVTSDIGRLPVVSRSNPKELVGYLGRSSILEARLKRIEEEHLREPGWWQAPNLQKEV